MTKAQEQTVDMLTSYVEDLEVAPLAEDDDPEPVLVFEGQGQDGPSVGYIEVDGQVTWICQG